jgi:ABC-type ATPase with predicted acetyltransferase domain
MNIELPTITRRVVPKRRELSLLKNISVEWGTKADWDALCELHYKGHTLAAGSRFMVAMLREPSETPRLVGVMVFANPQPLSKGRNDVFPRMKPNSDGRDNRLVNQARLSWINKNITWNNRTVLDTMYRSAGIAYRFKNLAYRMYCDKFGRKFVESVSSMGRFNPFSVKTGMKFVKPRPANAFEAGIAFFSGHFEASVHDVVGIQEELNAKPEAEKAFLDRRLREFYYRWSSMEKSGDKRDLGMERIDGLTIEYILKQIMQLVFSSTVYWIWQAVDTQKLPQTMPITAFDEQGANEPLARSWASGVSA